MMLMAENTERDSGRSAPVNCALKPRHNESVTWPLSEATCQIIGCVYFRRRSRRMSSDVWGLARPWRRFRRNWGLPGSYLYEWRWAWRRHGAAGLNRRRAPKKGLRRKMATSDPPGAGAKARIEELERLVGRQQLDLDFF